MVVEELTKCPKCGDEHIIKQGLYERVKCPKCGSTKFVGHGVKTTVKKGERKRCVCANNHVLYRDELIKFTDQRYGCSKGHTFYKDDSEVS